MFQIEELVVKSNWSSIGKKFLYSISGIVSCGKLSWRAGHVALVALDTTTAR